MNNDVKRALAKYNCEEKPSMPGLYRAMTAIQKMAEETDPFSYERLLHAAMYNAVACIEHAMDRGIEAWEEREHGRVRGILTACAKKGEPLA